MKIKKFEAPTEQEAIEKVKNEFGMNAMVLNITKTQPRGLFALFRKPYYQVTAAMDERGGAIEAPPTPEPIVQPVQPEANGFDEHFRETMLKDSRLMEQQRKIEELEERLVTTADVLKRVSEQLSVSQYAAKSNRPRRYHKNIVQSFHDTLMAQGVLPEIAEQILDELDLVLRSASETEQTDIAMSVRIVYNALIKILGSTQPIDTSVTKPLVVTFIGNTGVGKTTTIAKLSADFVLQKQLRVGLITCDTYRIAAVDQLKVYAEILGLEVGVAYSGRDLREFVDRMATRNDVLFVDTAGRSHKNDAALSETAEVLEAVPESVNYLVISMTTKYEDAIEIVKAYTKLTDFGIIFTKMDETNLYGTILNICFATGKRLSYVTNGQNVPEDFEIIRPEKIARMLLGLN